MDAKGTLYITDRYSGSQHIYRVPYNPTDGTWDFSPSRQQLVSDDRGGFNGAGHGGYHVARQPGQRRQRPAVRLRAERERDCHHSGERGRHRDRTSRADRSQDSPSSVPGQRPDRQCHADGRRRQRQSVLHREPVRAARANRSTGIFFIPASTYASCVRR